MQNWISLIGMTIASISIFTIIILFVISNFLGEGGLYLGLVNFILLPSVMIVGLIMIPIGAMLKSRRQKKKSVHEKKGWPVIDLNQKKHRRTFIIFASGTAFLLFASAIGSYEAFHYTESVTFCGQLCHIIMKPEHTAYQHSSHARVSCVECHVGPGADWYVRSKLSGLYQVYATLFNKYPKPIPTPIENLRPAREVCEQCHWPQKFYTYKYRFETYYLSDADNPEWDIRLIMKTGAEHQAQGLKEGIHWHINPDIQIDYIATDEKREDIAWVKFTHLKTNEVIVYENEDNPLDESEKHNHEVRRMDCIDCHNRPSHDYISPSQFIDTAIKAGEISLELPGIKTLALDLCARDYLSTDSALQTIKKEIPAYYEKNLPQIYTNKKALIEKAADSIQKRFSQYIFPEMKVRWDTHPNHIGHLDDRGCFRCHNGLFTSSSKGSIRRDCNLCHMINAQGPPNNLEMGTLRKPLEFRHPVDIDQAWKEFLCSECHVGASM
jgi:hypothetical protein